MKNIKMGRFRLEVKVNKVLVFIDDGAINQNGDVYPTGSIKVAKNPTPIFFNFNETFKIGEGELLRDSSNTSRIFANLTLRPKTKKDAEKLLDKFSGMFPAVRGILIPDENDKKKVGGLEIQSIGICDNPNADPRIQPILKDNMEIIEEDEKTE